MPVKIVNGETAGGAELAAKLADANSDGQTIMAIGVQNIHSYYNGFWKVNPADFSKFKIVAGNIQPNPDCGNMILTQTDAPFNTWEEFVKYVEEHPVEITAVSMPGKVMDLKMKALFNGTGVSKNIRWVPVASNAEATTALLNGTINCVMLDELTASHYLEDGTCKALINCRMDNDYSMYGNDPAIEKMKAVPTLLDVFGADAEKYMVPNRSVIIVPAGTPDDICDAIAKVINRIDEEPIGSEFYDKSHFIGGTSKYYSWPGDKIMAEWSRLDPIMRNDAIVLKAQ